MLTQQCADEQVRELLGGKPLFGLVNNAGVAFHGPLMHQPIAEFARNVEINLTGTLILTQASLQFSALNLNLDLLCMQGSCL